MTPKPWWLAMILSRRTWVCRFSLRDAVGASQSRGGTCLGKFLDVADGRASSDLTVASRTNLAHWMIYDDDLPA
jgi:hypothetical protein